MSNHQKPTKEQLKANMAASLDKLKTIPPETTPPTPPVTPAPPEPPIPPTPPTPPVQPPVAPPAPSVIDLTAVRTKKAEELTEDEKNFVKEHAAELSDEEKKTLGVTEVAPPKVDYEKKFKESSREAQVLAFKEKEMAKAEEEANKIPEPTDDEMKALYPNWETIDPLTKDLAKDRVLNKKKNEIMNAARAKFKNVMDWGEKVDKFVGDPAVLANHPELEGKTEEFKAFASKPTRRGVDFEDLLLAFSGEQAKTKQPPKTGQMFEPGSGGPLTPPKPKDDKITLAQGEQIRKTDYKKFKQLLKDGKIATA